MKNEELTSREIRRRRRIKSQITAYVILAVMVIVLIIGGIFGIRALVERVRAYDEKVSNALAEAESNVAQEVESEAVESSQTSIEQETESTQSEVDPLDELVESLLQGMTLEEKVAGLFIVTPESITGVGKVVQAGEGTKTALVENPVGGILYAEKNFISEEQFLEMMTNTKGFAEYPLFLAVQKESGSAESFGIETTIKASEMTGTNDVKSAFSTIAEKLASYGINMNLAPVADVVSEEGNTALQGRTFGSDAASATPLVNAAVMTLQEKEISAVLTKFPGEGSVDSSQGRNITKSLEELKNCEFLTYQMAIDNGVDCIMVSHAAAPEVTGDDTPCSMSVVMIQDTLRNILGFQGIVMTDMLNDKAITEKYSDGEAAVKAILAGADMLLVPSDYHKAHEGIMKAVSEGVITEERIQESLMRIYRVKYKHALENIE